MDGKDKDRKGWTVRIRMDSKDKDGKGWTVRIRMAKDGQ